ncbi:hypothetical protein KI688_005099 [Linnemannia hyalina]|uniref:Cytochrome P450 n=1 Tax=Linnemannia hyalina TaxID=64524 RepID=A0A9P7XLN8_9FUNG|nr:hypothetical protein KI688_005099 [Linnemannia hyalina]
MAIVATLVKEAGVTFREWAEQYGGILCYKSLFNSQIIHLADPEAIHHVFNTHAYQYLKPDRVIRVMDPGCRQVTSSYYSKIPLRHNQVRLRVARSIDKAVRQIVCQKRDRMALEKNDGKDLLSMIRASESSGNGMLTDDDLRAQIKNLLAAGNDTSLVAVTWMLHILSTRPKVQSRPRQEFLAHIGRPTDKTSSSTFNYDALHALPYLNICIKELFRFIPPVAYTSRVASQDDNVLGYDIPKGTEIQLMSGGEDAEEFKPERWMDPSSFSEEDQQSINFVTPDMLWADMPFLTGPRSCIGSKVALIETKVNLYPVLPLIDLEYTPVPGFTFKTSVRITVRPSPGMNLIVKRFEHDASVNPITPH